jgi:hypothetical protein
MHFARSRIRNETERIFGDSFTRMPAIMDVAGDQR